MKKQYPIAEGWLHLKIKHVPGQTFSQSQLLPIIGLTDDTAEVALFRPGKRTTTIVARRKRDEQAS